MKNKAEKKAKEIEKQKEKIKLNSEKIKDRERKIKAIKIGLLIMIMFLIIIYLVYIQYSTIKIMCYNVLFVILFANYQSIDESWLITLLQSIKNFVGLSPFKTTP